jgi:hypothetical protein
MQDYQSFLICGGRVPAHALARLELH